MKCMASKARKPVRERVEDSISAVSLVVFLGWAPAIYRCGYGMTRDFPLGELLACDEVMGALFLATLVNYLTTAASGSRRRSFIALTSTTAACASLFFATFVFRGGSLYVAGVRARLQQNVDPERLRQWALGMIPDAPQKEGAPIRLPNGESIGTDCGSADEKGGYWIFEEKLPGKLNVPLREPVGIRVKYDRDPSKRYVEIGSFGRFGLTIVVGPTNLDYQPFNLDSGERKWTNGIYIRIQGGG
jgi:hypothetical protein